MPIKTASAARSIQCRARTKRRRTGVDDIKTLTMLYQIKAVAKIRPIIRVISQAGVADVTAVAKTEINKTTALGLVGEKYSKRKALRAPVRPCSAMSGAEDVEKIRHKPKNQISRAQQVHGPGSPLILH
jgi:uncharacterized ferredoxin-like protein